MRMRWVRSASPRAGEAGRSCDWRTPGWTVMSVMSGLLEGVGNGAWLPPFVDRDISELGFGDFHGFGRARAAALREDLDVDSDRRPPDLEDARIEAHEVADEHGLFEDEGIHRDGDDRALRARPRGNAARDVDLRHHPAAEDGAVRS